MRGVARRHPTRRCYQRSHYLLAVVMFAVITPPPDVDDVTLERCARGFILALIGSFLFADKKGVMVPMCYLPLLRDLTLTATYSWGGAVLAHTYRELCRASLDRSRGISSCITLIQVCNNWECVLLCMDELGCLCHYYS